MTPTEPLPPAAFIPVPDPQTVCPLPNPKDTLFHPNLYPSHWLGCHTFVDSIIRGVWCLGMLRSLWWYIFPWWAQRWSMERAELGLSHHPIGSDLTNRPTDGLHSMPGFTCLPTTIQQGDFLAGSKSISILWQLARNIKEPDLGLLMYSGFYTKQGLFSRDSNVMGSIRELF